MFKSEETIRDGENKSIHVLSIAIPERERKKKENKNFKSN